MIQSKPRCRYSSQFKLDVINQSEHCEKIATLASDLGLRPDLVYHWRAEFNEAKELAGAWAIPEPNEKENAL